MSEQRVRQLMAAIGKVGDGYDFDEVLSACGNIMLNVLRQQHPKHINAEEQLDEVCENMHKALRREHYDENGFRNERRIILPSLGQLLDG